MYGSIFGKAQVQYSKDTLLKYNDDDEHDIKLEKARQWFEKIFYPKLVTDMQKKQPRCGMVAKRKFSDTNNDHAIISLTAEIINCYNTSNFKQDKFIELYNKFVSTKVPEEEIDEFDNNIGEHKSLLESANMSAANDYYYWGLRYIA